MKQLSDVTQKFAVSRASGDSDFKGDGLRSYALYRDFGFAAATEGMVHAHVIKLIPPCTDEVRTHEGQGVMTMKAGDAWLMPPGIKHTVLDYSDDCQNLEITVPAKFDTVDA